MDDDPFSPASVRDAYNTVAEDYAATFADDLAQLPVDRAVLDAAADLILSSIDSAVSAPVLDVGCGPAQISRHLAARGLPMIGLDHAVRMLAVAARVVPGAALAGADLRALPIRSGSCAGVIAFYSIQHTPRAQLGDAIAELGRVLRPGGVLAVAIHLGEGETALEEFLGHTVKPLGGTFYETEELRQAIVAHEFTVVDEQTRDPIEHEHPTQRLYVTARRTAA